jgi:anti-anti-sigma regulatory factor
VLDLCDLTFLDAAGLGVLVTAWRQAHARGATLTIAHARPPVRRLLDLAARLGTLPAGFTAASSTSAANTAPVGSRSGTEPAGSAPQAR